MAFRAPAANLPLLRSFSVERSGLGSVREGQKLAYELEKDRKSGKFAAGALKAI